MEMLERGSDFEPGDMSSYTDWLNELKSLELSQLPQRLERPRPNIWIVNNKKSLKEYNEQRVKVHPNVGRNFTRLIPGVQYEVEDEELDTPGFWIDDGKTQSDQVSEYDAESLQDIVEQDESIMFKKMVDYKEIGSEPVIFTLKNDGGYESMQKELIMIRNGSPSIKPSFSDIKIDEDVLTILEEKDVNRIIASEIHGSFDSLDNLADLIQKKAEITSIDTIRNIIQKVSHKEKRLEDHARRWYVHDIILNKIGVNDQQRDYVLQAKTHRWM
jgi:hypothetical protein